MFGSRHPCAPGRNVTPPPTLPWPPQHHLASPLQCSEGSGVSHKQETSVKHTRGPGSEKGLLLPLVLQRAWVGGVGASVPLKKTGTPPLKATAKHTGNAPILTSLSVFSSPFLYLLGLRPLPHTTTFCIFTPPPPPTPPTPSLGSHQRLPEVTGATEGEMLWRTSICRIISTRGRPLDV